MNYSLEWGGPGERDRPPNRSADIAELRKRAYDAEHLWHPSANRFIDRPTPLGALYRRAAAALEKLDELGVPLDG